MARLWLIAMTMVFALSGCAAMSGGGNKQIPNAAVQILDTQSLPEPTASDLYGPTRPYLIGPFDKLNIEVFGVEELTREVQADASGQISFPLIGQIDAAGKTPLEVAKIVETRLAGRYVKNPQVSVNMTDVVSQTMTVDGQVSKPGLYPVVGRMTLMRAVASAGGTSEHAKLDDVVIFRTVNGQQMAGLYNLQGIRKGNYEDPEVFANDVIIVGDSAGRRLFQDLLKTAPLFLSPLVLLIR
jgi:polysaccharide biosynthesis/export protein